jgi:hypothetical protein
LSERSASNSITRQLEGRTLDFYQHDKRIRVTIKPSRGRDIAADDERWFRDYVSQMGKWEKLVSGFQLFANSVSAAKPTPINSRNFDYEVEFDRNYHISTTAYVSMAYESRRIRLNEDLPAALSLNDFILEFDNVPKWQSLKNSWEFFRDNFLKPTEVKEK